MENFPPNSKLNKEEKQPERKIDKVVEGAVITRKKTFGEKFKDVFVGGDAKSVWQYVIYDVLVPAAKDMAADAVSQGFERLIFGESKSTSRHRNSYSNNGYVSYNRMSNNGSRNEPSNRTMTSAARANHDFSTFVIESRAEAEQVLERLYDLVSQYGTASVSDLYELVGVQANYTDKKWGWTDMRGSSIRRVREGYLLELPRTVSLD